MKSIAMINGDEYDALTKRGRTVHAFRAGQRAKVKRGYRRRARHISKTPRGRELDNAH
jgi:hypothetical protein